MVERSLGDGRAVLVLGGAWFTAAGARESGGEGESERMRAN